MHVQREFNIRMHSNLQFPMRPLLHASGKYLNTLSTASSQCSTTGNIRLGHQYSEQGPEPLLLCPSRGLTDAFPSQGFFSSLPPSKQQCNCCPSLASTVILPSSPTPACPSKSHQSRKSPPSYSSRRMCRRGIVAAGIEGQPSWSCERFGTAAVAAASIGVEMA